MPEFQDLFQDSPPPEAPSEPAPTTSTQAAPAPQDLPVSVDLQDVTSRIAEVNQAADVAAQLALQQARQAQHSQTETTAEYNERVKQEFLARVMEARRQAEAPPPPPQPVAPPILEQTKRELEAGRKQSAYWQEQQKLRPPPSARDIQAAGSVNAVFQPGVYTHEKGQAFEGKQHSASNLPSR